MSSALLRIGVNGATTSVITPAGKPMDLDRSRNSQDKPGDKFPIERNIEEAAMDVVTDAAVNAAGDLANYFEHLTGSDSEDSPGWTETKERFAEFHLILEPEQMAAKAAGKITENALRSALAPWGFFGIAAACVAGKIVENVVSSSSHPSEARERATEFLQLLEIAEYIEEDDVLKCDPFKDMWAGELKHLIKNLTGETPEDGYDEVRGHHSAEPYGSGSGPHSSYENTITRTFVTWSSSSTAI